jgi:hypothetical protein
MTVGFLHPSLTRRFEDADIAKERLCGHFAVWAASPEARFMHGRFLWAKWDVTELKEAELRERLEKDDTFLRVGVVGLREWESRAKVGQANA